MYSYQEFSSRYRQHQLIQRAPRRATGETPAPPPGKIRPLPRQGGFGMSLGRLKHGIGRRELYERYRAWTRTDDWGRLPESLRRLAVHALAEARGDDRQLIAVEALVATQARSRLLARGLRWLELLARAPDGRAAIVAIYQSGVLARLDPEVAVRIIDYIDGIPLEVSSDPDVRRIWGTQLAELAELARSLTDVADPTDAVQAWLDEPELPLYLFKPQAWAHALTIVLGPLSASSPTYARTLSLDAFREARAELRRDLGPLDSEASERDDGRRAFISRWERLCLLRWLEGNHYVESRHGICEVGARHKGRSEAAFELDRTILEVVATICGYRGELEWGVVGTSGAHLRAAS